MRTAMLANARLSQPSIVEGDGRTMPSDIQFMPPGRQVIAPMVNGKAHEMEVHVTPRYVDVFQSALEQLQANARAGQGDEPYIDFNHEDGKAAGQAVRFFWAGDDPKTGGVRLQVAWTGSGREAILGKDFRRFSPQWIFHKDTNEPLGLEVNVGGLVNKAAFRTIQPIAAAHAVSVFDSAGIVTTAVNRSEMLAQAAAAHPALYRQYRSALLGIPQTSTQSGDGGDMVAQARDMAERDGISFNQAVERLAHSNPELYKQYRRGMTRATAVATPAQRTHDSNGADEFMAAVTAQAREQNISETEAMERIAQARPNFYNTYRRSLLKI